MPGKTHTAGALPGETHRPRVLSWRGLLPAGLAVTVVVAIFYFTELEWRQVPAALERVSPPLALLIMATLPLIGFPISAVYLTAGLIFGPWLGLLVVAGTTAVHLVVTQLLARTVLRRPIERWRLKWSRRIPEVPPKEQITLVAMIVIVPGLPYFARNCLLAFSRIPWRLLLGVALPLYVLRSTTTIFLGDLGSEPSRMALIILVSVYALKVGVSALLFRRLKRSLKRKQ